MEQSKSDLEEHITENRIQHPALTREQIAFFLDQFKATDINDEEQRQRLIDSFVNAVYVYEDKIILKNHPHFKRILSDFRQHFGLGKYTAKELDQYLWQLGKEYFI